MEVLHCLLLLVGLNGDQRLDAGDAQGQVQRVEHLWPLQGHVAVRHQPRLHVVQDAAADVTQSLRRSHLVEGAAGPHLRAGQREALLHCLAHARDERTHGRRAAAVLPYGPSRPCVLQQRQAMHLHRAPEAKVEVLLLPFLVRLLSDHSCPGTAFPLRVHRHLLRAELLQEGERASFVLQLSNGVVEEQSHLMRERLPVLGKAAQARQVGGLVRAPLSLE
mmetsp:Transcript_26093/g.66485  ORF Transcript_26093/g.66485 Transcript_26093/m.66485 type:complete len:220 (+) Transcript_26093:1212-1871(+)